MTKRSQMEIMGITIVVIILSIVILFVIRWGVLKEPVQYKKEFAQSEIATNLVNTMLSTTTNCKGLTFNELFQDCFENWPDGKTADCPGLIEDIASCSYVQNQLITIFSNTLEVWNYEYEFTVTKTGTSYKIGRGNCEAKERKSRTYPLPGNLEAKLAICG